jgi:hypothetical protein
LAFFSSFSLFRSDFVSEVRPVLGGADAGALTLIVDEPGSPAFFDDVEA